MNPPAMKAVSALALAILVGAGIGLALGLVAALTSLRLQPPPSQSQQQPGVYPTPSGWTLTPFPQGTEPPQVQHTSSPPSCPAGETLINHGSYYECRYPIPPAPSTGPYLAPCQPALASPYPCPTPNSRP